MSIVLGDVIMVVSLMKRAIIGLIINIAMVVVIALFEISHCCRSLILARMLQH